MPTFPETLNPKACAFCATEFTPERLHQKYCGEKCRKAAYWSKHETVGPEVAQALDWALDRLKKQSANPHFVTLESLRRKIKE